MRSALESLQNSPEWSNRRIENPNLWGGRILLDTPEQIVVHFEYGSMSEHPQRRAWFAVADGNVSRLTASECRSLGIRLKSLM